MQGRGAPRRGRFATWAISSAAVLSMCGLCACGAGRGQGGGATVGEGDPQIERVAGIEGISTEVPPHILICGLHKNLVLPLEVATYNSDQDALSLYDFAHDEGQLQTWMAQHPGGRAWKVRQHPDDKGPRGAIGRQISEPCFGNGAEAEAVIRQVIVVRAGGADAGEALHNLLREGRSVHFLVDRDGQVHQTLDPVHAAIAPTEHANVAIYVAMVAPRRTAEWLPSVLVRGAAPGVAGALGTTAGPGGAAASVAPPPDVFAERAQCAVGGSVVLSEQYLPAQERSLAALLWALADEYPRIALEAPIARDGSMLREFMPDSLYHVGVLADYHTREAAHEPACLDLERILSLEE